MDTRGFKFVLYLVAGPPRNFSNFLSSIFFLLSCRLHDVSRIAQPLQKMQQLFLRENLSRSARMWRAGGLSDGLKCSSNSLNIRHIAAKRGICRGVERKAAQMVRRYGFRERRRNDVERLFAVRSGGRPRRPDVPVFGPAAFANVFPAVVFLLLCIKYVFLLI